MGKFAIGARVRDDDGDEGRIIDKDGKYCTVEYDSGIYASVKKKWLTPVNTGGDTGVDLARAEVCKSDYSAPPGAGNSEWVPKVGDRVAYKDEFASGVGTVISGAPEEGFAWTVRPDDPRAEYFYLDGRFGYVTRHFEADSLTPAPLTITAGKSYRTRDGRKVGPMKREEDYLTAGGCHYAINGECCYRGMSKRLPAPNLDLVAEWVEAEPASVAEAPATPERKFKVGDRVLIARNSRGHAWLKKYIGREFIISGECGTEDAPGWSFDGCGFWWPEVDLDLATHTPPIGSTVTFTATGRLSAINENGHYQVTFPGLAPAQNSFALPAQYVTPAN